MENLATNRHCFTPTQCNTSAGKMVTALNNLNKTKFEQNLACVVNAKGNGNMRLFQVVNRGKQQNKINHRTMNYLKSLDKKMNLIMKRHDWLHK